MSQSSPINPTSILRFVTALAFLLFSPFLFGFGQPAAPAPQQGELLYRWSCSITAAAKRILGLMPNFHAVSAGELPSATMRSPMSFREFWSDIATHVHLNP